MNLNARNFLIFFKNSFSWAQGAVFRRDGGPICHISCRNDQKSALDKALLTQIQGLNRINMPDTEFFAPLSIPLLERRKGSKETGHGDNAI
jgi:hypothetical protein